MNTIPPKFTSPSSKVLYRIAEIHKNTYQFQWKSSPRNKYSSQVLMVNKYVWGWIDAPYDCVTSRASTSASGNPLRPKLNWTILYGTTFGGLLPQNHAPCWLRPPNPAPLGPAPKHYHLGWITACMDAFARIWGMLPKAQACRCSRQGAWVCARSRRNTESVRDAAAQYAGPRKKYHLIQELELPGGSLVARLKDMHGLWRVGCAHVSWCCAAKHVWSVT